MTPTLPLLDGDTLVVSPTQLEVIRTCPSMWRWRYLYRRVKATPNAAAQGGKAFDAALNFRYTALGNKPVTPEVEDLMLGMIDAAYEGVELPLEEYRTAARYKEAVQVYNAAYQQESWEVLGVQVPFKVELGSVWMGTDFWSTYHKACKHEWLPLNSQGHEPCSVCGARRVDQHTYWPDKQVRVVLQGLLDLFVRDGDHIMVIDTKTSKSDIDGSYENSAQMKAYCWALQELARLHPTAGLPPVVHAARINGVVIRPPYKDETRKPKNNDKPRTEVKRSFPSFYTPERLERWRQDTLAWVEQALGWVARDHFPQNERHCTFHVDAAFTNYGYYGKPCPYLGVCSLPESQQEMALASDEYMDYERGPLAALDATPEEAP